MKRSTAIVLGAGLAVVAVVWWAFRKHGFLGGAVAIAAVVGLWLKFGWTGD